jgi:hypothetical protein
MFCFGKSRKNNDWWDDGKQKSISLVWSQSKLVGEREQTVSEVSLIDENVRPILFVAYLGDMPSTRWNLSRISYIVSLASSAYMRRCL